MWGSLWSRGNVRGTVTKGSAVWIPPILQFFVEMETKSQRLFLIAKRSCGRVVAETDTERRWLDSSQDRVEIYVSYNVSYKSENNIMYKINKRDRQGGPTLKKIVFLENNINKKIPVLLLLFCHSVYLSFRFITFYFLSFCLLNLCILSFSVDWKG